MAARTADGIVPPPPPGRYLLLGASGLTGSHALRVLAGRAGVEVRAVGHSRLPEVRAGNVSALRCDLRRPGAVDELLEGVDYVLFFAGRVLSAPILAVDPVGPVFENLRLGASVLEGCWRAGVRKTVWLSSTTGYPPAAGPIAEDQMFVGDPPDVWYLVGWTSRYLETVGRGLAARSASGAAFIALRPSLVYGEHDDFSESGAHFLPALVRRVVERERPIEVWGDGSERRDVIHAEDVAAAAFAALSVVEGFDAFNVCAGRSHSVTEVLERIVVLDGYEGAEIAYRTSGARTVAERSFSNRRAREVLGFRPRVDLDEGLARTIAWFRENRLGRARV
jgi:GDP-L-fucose synthase